MCGVIGLRCEKDREDLGAAASRLLRMLEYRGYDSTGAPIKKAAVRSHLKVEETELKKPFKYFMEQEIFSEVEASRRVLNYFADRSPLVELARKVSAKKPRLVSGLKSEALKLASLTQAAELKAASGAFLSSAAEKALPSAALRPGDSGARDEKLHQPAPGAVRSGRLPR